MADMKDTHEKKTDDEIESEVLANRNDPSAWETLPLVPPSASPRPAWMFRSRHLELAARFHVLYRLHLLGLEANLTLSQPYGTDITVLRESGEQATIDVKTVTSECEWWPANFIRRKHHFVVFVDFGEGLSRLDVAPNVYVTASERLHAWLSREKQGPLTLEQLEIDLKARNAWNALVVDPVA